MCRRPVMMARVAVLALSGLPALAQTGTGTETGADAGIDAGALPPAGQHDVNPAFVRAYDVAMARINQSLTHDEMAQINLLAYAAAAAGMCPGLELDEGAIYAALTESGHDSLQGLSAKDADRHRDFTLIAFGILTGLILEDGAGDETAFCADADAYSDEAAINSFIRRVPPAGRPPG